MAILRQIYSDYDARAPLLAVSFIGWLLMIPFYIKAGLFCLFFISVALKINKDKTEIVGIFVDKHIIYFHAFILYLFSSYIFLSFDFALSHRPSIVAAIVSYLLFLVVQRSFDQDAYAKFINILIQLTTILLIYLLLIHILYFQSYFLTPVLFDKGQLELGFSHKNKLAFFLLVIFPFVYERFVKEKNFQNILSFLLFSVALFYTFSKSAFLFYFFGIALFVFISRKNRKCFFHLGAVILFFVTLYVLNIFTPQKFLELKRTGNLQISSHEYTEELNSSKEHWLDVEPAKESRYAYALLAIDGFKQKPFVGHGIASFQRDHYFFRDNGEIKRKPLSHNDYLGMLYELGFVGLAFYLIAIGSLIKRLWRGRSRQGVHVEAQFVCLLVLVCIQFTMNIYDSPLFWLFVAGSFVVTDLEKSCIKQEPQS